MQPDDVVAFTMIGVGVMRENDSSGTVSPVERPHRDGSIDTAARDACARWQRDYLVGTERVRDSSLSN